MILTLMTFAVVQATRCAPLPVCTACVDTWAFVGGFFAAPIFLPADIFLTCTTTNIPGFSLLRVPALFLNRLCIRVSTWAHSCCTYASCRLYQWCQVFKFFWSYASLIWYPWLPALLVASLEASRIRSNLQFSNHGCGALGALSFHSAITT